MLGRVHEAEMKPTHEHTLDAKLESLRRELLDHKGSPVLVCSSSEGSGVPAMFVIGDVVMLPTKVLKGQRETNEYFSSGPLIAIGNTTGPLYQLVGNKFVPDKMNGWGRNYFPNVGNYLAFGRENVLRALKEAYGYEGELPDFV